MLDEEVNVRNEGALCNVDCDIERYELVPAVEYK